MPTMTSHATGMNFPHSKNMSNGGVSRATSSTLTFSRSWLVHVANETLDVARSGKYINCNGEVVILGDALVKAMDNSVHYHCMQTIPPPEEALAQFDTEFHICYGSSLNVAWQLSDNGHIGILNSASGKNPGGKFFRGTISQEDCICRATLLYPCLAQYKDKPHHYYKINNAPKYQASSSSCAIFSPLVPVIREDSVEGKFLDCFRSYSFLSIPAPNAFVVGKSEDEHNVPKAQTPGDKAEYESITLRQAMRDRIFRALCIFAEHGCTELVLCAFGCGVHGNNPSMVAGIFKDILTHELKNQFRTVVFAIQPSRHANYRAFTSVFPEASTFDDDH